MKEIFNIRHFFFLAFLFIVSGSQAVAAELEGEKVKAVYLYNFLKHIKWPNEHQKAYFVVGVYNDENFYKTLQQAFTSRQVKGKSISVVTISSAEQAKNVDLLYIPSQFNHEIGALSRYIRNSHTLLVSEQSDDNHNVMINLLHNEETSAISFEVNKSNVVYEQLEMSAELLLFGGTELDVATLYRETEGLMQQIKERERILNMKLAAQEQHIENSAKRLAELNKALINRNKELYQHKEELNDLQIDINQQRKAITAKELKLSSILQQLEVSENELALSGQQLLFQQEAIGEKENKNTLMADSIKGNEKILRQQQQKVDEQLSQLNQQNKELMDRNVTINEQQRYVLITSILIAITTIVSILMVLLFIRNRRTMRELSDTLVNLKETQDQLVQSDKMAALGNLTAGIAHEINTPLGIAVTSTSLALESTELIQDKFNQGILTKSIMKKYLSEIEQSSLMNTRALERVITLLTNFKQVAADQAVDEVRSFDLVVYIDEVMSTLSAELKRHHIIYHYQGVNELTILTIPGAIAQVLTNFVTNSIKHGFDGKASGNITIKLEVVDDKVQLTYKDDGMGMTDDVLKNIYEPFFTTKRNKGGTGLGMNIVYNIIDKNLKGDINISSQVDEGAQFILTLPKEL